VTKLLVAQQQKICTFAEPIAAVPEWWQVRPEAQRSQLIVQYAERFFDGKHGAPKYALTIPHFNAEINIDENTFPRYNKGNTEGILTLKDNSKVIVNCVGPSNAQEMLEVSKTLILPQYLEGSSIKIGQRLGRPIQTKSVYPRIAKYFPTGQKDMKPEWVKYLYER
jgi:hypothetical protein